MRSILAAAGILVFAAQAFAQTAPETTTADTAAAPPLIKTVAADPNDSPMVRAAKRAVASRKPAAQRRVVSLTASSSATRGRVAYSTGPAEGPKLPPPVSDAKPAPPPPKVLTASEAAAKQRAEAQEKLRKLEAEEQQLGTEVDEPYGNDVDEDYVEKRLSEIAEERKKLQQQTPPPPPR
jgi:hypothetical protein